MRKAALLLLLAVLGAREARPEVSAPFVSRLKAQAGQASITLSWRPVPGFEGSYRIYRHTREIDEASFPAAVQVAAVGPGVASYEDFPPGREAYFYAVLLDDGKLSPLFSPFRNKTSAPAQIADVAPEPDLAARISGLTAEVVEDAVRLRFQASRGDRELLLFRSLYPMRSGEDLLAASSPVALDPGARGYEDYPIPGLDYYYALIDAGLFKIGKPELAVGESSTTRPVQVPIGAGRVGLPPPSAGLTPAAVASEPAAEAAARAPAAAAPAARSAPLPYLALDDAMGLPATPLPAARPLSPATRRAVEAVLAEAPPRAARMLPVQALSEDLGAGGESEGFGLGVLLADYLLKGDLPGAEKGLLAFLAVRRSAAAEARAHFYLGQVYYLQGNLERSVLELLLARQLYYAAVEPWLDACLLGLRVR